MVRPSGKLIIGGQTFDTDAPIVNWREGPQWDATSIYCMNTRTESNALGRCVTDPKGGHRPYGPPVVPYVRRYSTRPQLRQSKWGNGEHAPYDAVKSVIKQFVIHHDGCASADMCWNVLQNERGLSVHFLLDNDGTIYQTIDLGLMAYHAAEWNLHSIGVELCNRGDARKEPHYYKNSPDRRPVACKINNYTYLAFDYTPAQYESLRKLGRALLRLLPNLPAEYPQTSPGVQSWDTLPTSASFGFSGYIGHYHLTKAKWDPGFFEFDKFCSSIRGSLCFPMYPRGEPKKQQDRPIVPQESSELKEDTSLLYKLNEQRADGGFFPVGPWGDSRLWHGGVHLAAKTAKEPVFSPFPGRLVAARFGAESPVGSVNFMLIRHLMSLGTRKVEFFSLYMHLADEMKESTPAEWMAKSDVWKAKAKPGQTVLLDEAIEAGALIGRVGTAGPAEYSKSQIHVEIFAASEVFANYSGSPWELIDGSSSGRFCDNARINGLIDANKDGLLSKQELGSFFSSNATDTHFLVTFNVSEWTAEPSWAEALRQPADFKSMKADEIEALVAEQITPGLWWTEQVASHARLPPDGVVYHYHPISFVSWFNQQLVDAQVEAKASGAGKANEKDAKEVPKGVTDDRAGEGMLSIAEIQEDPCNAKLTLKELVEGYDAPECGP